MSDPKNVDIWIAGAFAAFTVDLIVYPLDTIKTRLQSPDYHKLYTNGHGNGNNRAFFRGVYQGVGSVILATLPSSGAFFTTYEGIKSTLENSKLANGSTPLLPQALIHSVASGSAELVSCAILTPAEVIKQNAQMVDNSDSNRPRVNATLQTMRRFRHNPLALWRGYTALAGRNLPFTALQFPLFERIKLGIQRYRDDKGVRTNTLLEGGMITAASAGTGGAVSAVVTTPVDVVKTRIMLAAAENAAADQKPSDKPAKGTLFDATGKPIEAAKDTLAKGKETIVKAAENIAKPPSRKGSMQIAREIMSESGVKGLFRGGALRGVWTMLGSGLYLDRPRNEPLRLRDPNSAPNSTAPQFQLATTRAGTIISSVAVATAPALAFKRGTLGFALGTKNADGSCKAQSDYEADFDAIKRETGATLVRGYSASDCDCAQNILPAAKSKGFKVVLGVWPDVDESFNADKDALTTYATKYTDQVYAVTVGSETLYRGTFTGSELLEKIDNVRAVLPGVKVGTADSWNKYADGTADALIRGGVELLMANAFAYWQGKEVGAGAQYTYFDDMQQALGRIQEISGSLDAIEFWNGETGWPTDGGTNYEAATASTKLASTYYSSGVCGMLDWGINIFVFEAFDEPWKPASVGDNGEPKDETHWGVMNADRSKKAGYALHCQKWGGAGSS